MMKTLSDLLIEKYGHEIAGVSEIVAELFPSRGFVTEEILGEFPAVRITFEDGLNIIVCLYREYRNLEISIEHIKETVEFYTSRGTGGPKIRCQQLDISKIRDGIKGHGLQAAIAVRRRRQGQQIVSLACGCSLPVSYLPGKEKNALAEMIRICDETTRPAMAGAR